MIWILLLAAFVPNELTIDLDQGWNLISAPLDNPIIKENIYHLENTKYTPTSGQLNYQTGTGYWIFSNQIKQIKINGQISKNTQIQLNPGWNLVGSPILKPIRLNEIKINNIPITQFTNQPIYTYKNQFITLNENSIIQPGTSFFIHSNTNSIAEFNNCCQEITNYAITYSKSNIQTLNNYNTVIIKEHQYTKDELQSINNPICYLSIGEEDSDTNINSNNEPKPWHFYINSIPQKNPTFGGHYTNANNPEWQNTVLNILIPKLTIKGCKGFFLDTIDTIDLFPESKQGMIDLIKKIKQQYPSHQIIANRGFTIAPDIKQHINAIMFESFSSYYDYNQNQYKIWQGNDLQYTTDVANQLKQIGVKILTLDYSIDPTQKQQNINRASQFNFISYNTDAYLSLS